MNLEDIKKRRIKSLTNAYNELDKMLNSKIQTDEVDPERRKVAASMYKQAAEDSDYILKQLQELLVEEGLIEPEKKKNTVGLSPEQRGTK